MHFTSSSNPTSSNMNSSSDTTNAFSFTGGNNFDGSAYCQGIQGQGASDQAQVGSMDSMNGQGLGGGLNGINNLAQLLQVQGQGSQGVGGLSSPDVQATNAMSPSINNQSNSCWQSCRFCQQKFFATSERLLEHEISCPMHLQVQQFLQQQQAQTQQLAQAQAQNDLQAQLQMQQNQLQSQFNAQYGQTDSMFGNLGNFNASSNAFSGQGLQGQGNLGLSNLLNQQAQQQSGIDAAQFHQVSSSSNEQQQQQRQQQDQFESAINNLPSFDMNSQQQQSQAQTQQLAQASTQPQAPRAEPKPLTSSQPGSSTDYFPLAMAEDEEWLTPLHCFVRKYCVEVFVATPEDVAAPCMGKRNPVSVNQVGIRCPYCSPERMGQTDQVDVARARENGVVYPSLISRIYNSSINLLQRHLKSCAFVPPEIISRYEELKSSNARSGASKKYWADSASRLGLVDTPDGIRLDKEVHRAHLAQAASAGEKSKGSAASLRQPGSEAPPLVLPSDKRNTTAFTFHLMSQMQPCVFTEADRLGRRRGLEVGFAGLACRHCFGVYGSGRFFPSSVKTMADASKTLDVIYRHMMKCKNCPCDIKGGLRNLRDFHDSERSKMPFGNQRAFFVKIWGRLHEGNDQLVLAQAAPGQAAAISRAPRAMPALQRPVAAAMVPRPIAAQPQQQGEVKLNAVRQPSGEGLQGLYAMVKRESTNENDQAQNKLVNEAA